jgi:hypothetical protein
MLRHKNVPPIKARPVRAFLFQMEHNKYPMQINEITQRLPSFRAQVRIQQQTITTELQAANITQARLLLQHLYGTGRVLSLLAV